MLEKYLHMFAKLRTDKSRDRYPQITYHRAPHKPFLLLSIIDLIAQGRITDQHGHELSGVRQGVSALPEPDQDNLRTLIVKGCA
jgi:hypothetical protein